MWARDDGWPYGLGMRGMITGGSVLEPGAPEPVAGSLAWSNFFSRTTHTHPGRVVWMVFNISIALLLIRVQQELTDVTLDEAWVDLDDGAAAPANNSPVPNPAPGDA